MLLTAVCSILGTNSRDFQVEHGGILVATERVFRGLDRNVEAFLIHICFFEALVPRTLKKHKKRIGSYKDEC